MRIEQVKVATILINTAVSDIIDLEAYRSVGFIIPAGWTTANLTFLAGDTPSNPADMTDVTNFVSITDEAGTELSVTAAASKAIGIRPNANALLPFRYIAIRSGTLAVPVNQAAQRKIKVLLRDPSFEQ